LSDLLNVHFLNCSLFAEGHQAIQGYDQMSHVLEVVALLVMVSELILQDAQVLLESLKLAYHLIFSEFAAAALVLTGPFIHLVCIFYIELLCS
jgi:hypothetical protein